MRPLPEREASLAAGEKAGAKESPGLRYYLLALLLCFLWGVGFTAMKVAVSETGPYFFAWLRTLLAGVAVVFYLKLIFKDVSLRSPSWRPLLINALLSVLWNVATALGINLTTASRTAVIFYTQPILVAFMAHYLLKGDRLGLLKLLGVALAFSGLVLIFSEKLGGWALRGDLLILASAFFWAFQTIYVKHYLGRENPFLVVAWQNLVGFPPIFALALLMGAPVYLELSLTVAAAILYCGPVAVGFAVVLWVKMLQDYPASRFSSFLFLTPVFGVLIGHLTLGDPLGGAMILGVALVCGGIYLVNRPARESP
ncbi:MAG: DMT family transporter [Nitrospinota bacterium]